MTLHNWEAPLLPVDNPESWNNENDLIAQYQKLSSGIIDTGSMDEGLENVLSDFFESANSPLSNLEKGDFNLWVLDDRLDVQKAFETETLAKNFPWSIEISSKVWEVVMQWDVLSEHGGLVIPEFLTPWDIIDFSFNAITELEARWIPTEGYVNTLRLELLEIISVLNREEVLYWPIREEVSIHTWKDIDDLTVDDIKLLWDYIEEKYLEALYARVVMKPYITAYKQLSFSIWDPHSVKLRTPRLLAPDSRWNLRQREVSNTTPKEVGSYEDVQIPYLNIPNNDRTLAWTAKFVEGYMKDTFFRVTADLSINKILSGSKIPESDRKLTSAEEASYMETQSYKLHEMEGFAWQNIYRLAIWDPEVRWDAPAVDFETQWRELNAQINSMMAEKADYYNSDVADEGREQYITSELEYLQKKERDTVMETIKNQAFIIAGLPNSLDMRVASLAEHREQLNDISSINKSTEDGEYLCATKVNLACQMLRNMGYTAMEYVVTGHTVVAVMLSDNSVVLFDPTRNIWAKHFTAEEVSKSSENWYYRLKYRWIDNLNGTFQSPWSSIAFNMADSSKDWVIDDKLMMGQTWASNRAWEIEKMLEEPNLNNILNALKEISANPDSFGSEHNKLVWTRAISWFFEVLWTASPSEKELLLAHMKTMEWDSAWEEFKERAFANSWVFMQAIQWGLSEKASSWLSTYLNDLVSDLKLEDERAVNDVFKRNWWIPVWAALDFAKNRGFDLWMPYDEFYNELMWKLTRSNRNTLRVIERNMVG